MQKRNVINSPRLQELKNHRKRIIWMKIVLSLVAIGALFSLAVYIFRIHSFNISVVEISGSKAVDAEMIKTQVQSEIAGNYLWLLPKTNIFLYPKNNIKKDLYNQFKSLKDINFSIKDGGILEVTVTERVASYVWCGATPPEVQNVAKCYLMDEAGYIFDEAPYVSGDVYFKFYGGTGINLSSPSGSYFSPDIFSKLIQFKKTLENLGLKPVTLYREDGGDVRISLSSSSGNTMPQVIFQSDADFQTTAENLETALSTEPLMSDFKNKYSSLEYIDLRYGNKVYYKFK